MWWIASKESANDFLRMGLSLIVYSLFHGLTDLNIKISGQKISQFFSFFRLHFIIDKLISRIVMTCFLIKFFSISFLNSDPQLLPTIFSKFDFQTIFSTVFKILDIVPNHSKTMKSNRETSTRYSMVTWQSRLQKTMWK